MTGALAWIEVRHLVRSPLLWLGFALGVAFATLNMVPWSSWPVLAGDDVVVYTSGGPLLSGGAVLAGAWLALRDRTSGTANLVAVTPTAAWRLWGARLASVAVAAAGGYAVAFVLGLAFSAVRGGRGIPDLRLLADGALAVVLSGWVGVAVGRLSGSRIVSLLAAPMWVAFCLVAGTWLGMARTELSFERLSPLLGFGVADRSAEFGLLPDPLWPHLGYLLGLVLLAGVGVLGLAARGSGQRPPLRSMLAVGLAGMILVAAGGTGVVTLPSRLVVLGPDRADWKPLSEAEVEAMASDSSWTYPDDGRATSCTADTNLEVCVYPAYGQRLARHTLTLMQPVARLFAGLPGVPTRVRMVPDQHIVPGPHHLQSLCRGTELRLGERQARSGTSRASRFHYVHLYLRCALHPGGDPDSYSRDVVQLWALQASGTITTGELRRAAEGDPIPELILIGASPAMAAAALAMAQLPADRVRSELAPVWDQLRASQLPLSELPGQQS
jgi:hypothetical protein